MKIKDTVKDYDGIYFDAIRKDRIDEMSRSEEGCPRYVRNMHSVSRERSRNSIQ